MKKSACLVCLSLLLASSMISPTFASAADYSSEAGNNGMIYEAEEAELVNNWVYDGGYINDEKVGSLIGQSSWKYVDGYIEGYDVELTPLDCSGGKVAGFFNNDPGKGGNADDPGSINFTVDIPSDGLYRIIFKTFSPYGDKQNDIQIDDDAILSGMLITPKSDNTMSTMSIEYDFTAGTHNISIIGNWGFIYVDCIIVAPTAVTVGKLVGSDHLCTDIPTPNTTALIEYLSDIYGTYSLSALCADGAASPQVNGIYELTGEYPAIIFFDAFNKSTLNAATDWFHNGGIVGVDFACEGYDEKQIDDLAALLIALHKNNVPVLIRPDIDSSEYVDTWRAVYDRLVDYYGLNNLIWIWSDDEGCEYPGDAYVDIVGGCIYKETPCDYSGSPERFLELKGVTKTARKMVGLSKTNTLPNAAMLQQSGDIYLFVSPENEYLFSDNGSIITDYTEKSMIKRFFTHKNVITLSELPDMLSGASETADYYDNSSSDDSRFESLSVIRLLGIVFASLIVIISFALLIYKKNLSHRRENQ